MRNLDQAERKSPCCPRETIRPWPYQPGAVYCPNCGTVNPVRPDPWRTPARWLKFRILYAKRAARFAWWGLLDRWDARGVAPYEIEDQALGTAAAPAVRSRRCPLCETLPGEPCQPKPAGDHLARYLDAATAGKLTRAYMAKVLGELVVIDVCAVVTVPAQPTAARGEDGSR